MPAQVLEPVVRMKVDELFLNWLSELSTQAMLKDYLMRIKNGECIDPDGGLKEGKDKPSVLSENSNVPSKKSLAERMLLPVSAPSSPPSTALPTGNGRAGPSSRSLRRSISTRRAQVKKEEPITPVLSESIPKFYFPRGRPPANLNIDTLISRIEKIFSQFPNERVTIEDMGKVAKACDCPLYWKALLFLSAGGDRTGSVSVHKFVAMWRKTLQTCHDDASKFVHILAKPGCNYLEQEDFIPFLQDVVNSHTGLAFLKEASEFHSRYITTVVQRIFYNVNRSWTGRITCSELRKSSFLQNVALLEEVEDVNQLTEYFSYEHFYVIYCKFWELDTDHDLYIDQRDLAQHNDQAISQKMIERLFSGTVTRDKRVLKEGLMSYADFVWFLISEEDKRTPTSIEYWFRCMDLDGDGVLSMYELEYFYEEQCQRLEAKAIESLPFEDCLCQMLDLVKPEVEGKITLRDLKKCKMSHIFFDTFFNTEKYLDHEQRDPLSVIRDETEGQDLSDWEKYAAEEYDLLVAEETANEQYRDGYGNAFNQMEDHISSDASLRTDKRHLFAIPSPHCSLDLDEYEYEEDFE
ncbi:serine/threonine-protein phosphatase 2A regulatory subunit B'' subunit beta isoform X1 [Scleropages formosus]|uniref:serine/threonine-protein phosphatase 2A regulatory subunit B'' subunit beta isoform X1 n=1 Tax=Scleropages formosus TaxID=113540 RepID=UPI000878C845|nr:serine/threonine-protein phosphatase 2A regulatory subunit B'' subunit beta isoform X1 [Scleropages formosus]XP_018594728.1 serine/threonine-protein phosphatase 2A regulatory subunit B'' subunit beta isoform X1 [Scleropages formosus]XP_018594729.1 serine/threonine-protein phosphatase 2A regulatory subunit B'' subunit beta isoform X1 [Scleropages formosus]